MLTEEQVENIKKQIIAQIDSWEKPDTLKQQAKQQIESMNAEQLEEFLAQNKLMNSSASGKQEGQQCPFCLIIKNKIPSYKIDENADSVAILEINPASKGHMIVIPKKHVEQEKLPASALELAQKASAKLKQIFKPKEVNISTSNIMGHSFINVIPTYGKETGERKQAKPEELKKLQKELTEEPEKKKAPSKPKSKPKPKKLEKAPRRIP